MEGDVDIEAKRLQEKRNKILVTIVISVFLFCILMYLLYINGKYVAVIAEQRDADAQLTATLKTESN